MQLQFCVRSNIICPVQCNPTRSIKANPNQSQGFHPLILLPSFKADLPLLTLSFLTQPSLYPSPGLISVNDRMGARDNMVRLVCSLDVDTTPPPPLCVSASLRRIWRPRKVALAMPHAMRLL